MNNMNENQDNTNYDIKSSGCNPPIDEKVEKLNTLIMDRLYKEQPIYDLLGEIYNAGLNKTFINFNHYVKSLSILIKNLEKHDDYLKGALKDLEETQIFHKYVHLYISKNFKAGTKFRSLFGATDIVSENSQIKIDGKDVYIRGKDAFFNRLIFNGKNWAETLWKI